MLARAAERGVDLRQAIAGHAHEQVMLGVIIHPIWSNRRAREPARMGGSRLGEGILAARRRAGMFGEVEDAEVKLNGRREAGQPEQVRRPAVKRERSAEEPRLRSDSRRGGTYVFSRCESICRTY